MERRERLSLASSLLYCYLGGFRACSTTLPFSFGGSFGCSLQCVVHRLSREFLGCLAGAASGHLTDPFKEELSALPCGMMILGTEKEIKKAVERFDLCTEHRAMSWGVGNWLF